MRHVMTSFFGIQLPPRPPPKKTTLFVWILSNDLIQISSFKMSIFHSPKHPKVRKLNSSPTSPTSQPPSPSPKRFEVGTLLWPKPSNSAVGTVECNSAPNPFREFLTGIFGGKKKERAGRATRVGTSGISLGEKDEFWICLPSFFWAKKKIPGLGWATLVVFFWNLLEMFIQTTI